MTQVDQSFQYTSHWFFVHLHGLYFFFPFFPLIPLQIRLISSEIVKFIPFARGKAILLFLAAILKHSTPKLRSLEK